MAQQATNRLSEAIENYQKGCDLDATNQQCRQMLDQAEAVLMQQTMGGMGGMGNMFGGGKNPFGGGEDGPFSAAALTKLKSNPKIAMHLMDVKFRNLYDLCIQNPQMLMQVMQMDPRFTDVFSELTGINLGDMAENKQKYEQQTEAQKQAQEEERQQAKAQAEAARKAAEEAALPSEEKIKVMKAKDAEAKKLQGNEFYKQKKFDKALELYTEAVELNSLELLYYTNIAACHIETKNYAAALEMCDKAIAIAREQGNYDYSKMAKVMARKASALEKAGQIELALQTYADALLENNDSTIKDAMKRLEKVKKEQEAKAYLNPDIAEVHKTKGIEHFKSGDFPAAIKEFDEGLRRDPTNVAIYSNRSLAFIKLLAPIDALKDAMKCIELDPAFVKGWARKGTCHQLMKEYHKAIDAFDHGLKLDPASKECNEGKMKTMQLINSSSTGNDEERMRHAMADPEIQ